MVVSTGRLVLGWMEGGVGREEEAPSSSAFTTQVPTSTCTALHSTAPRTLRGTFVMMIILILSGSCLEPSAARGSV